jgi:hypothetical protein
MNQAMNDDNDTKYYFKHNDIIEIFISNVKFSNLVCHVEAHFGLDFYFDTAYNFFMIINDFLPDGILPMATITKIFENLRTPCNLLGDENRLDPDNAEFLQGKEWEELI